MRTEQHLIHNAISATASTDINIDGATRATFVLTRTNHASGNTVYTFLVSVDGDNFYAFNKLVSNTANTSSQTITRVVSVTQSSATTDLVSLDLQHDVFRKLRITATITTDGKATVKGLVEFK